MKYYAVKIGRVPGVYTTWSECEMQVKGYKGAIYKSFKSIDDAHSFCENEQPSGSCSANKQPEIPFQSKPCATHAISNRCAAYVDGSFNNSIGRYGYGFVFLMNGEVISKEFNGGAQPEFASIRNVAGEIIAAAKAIQKAMDLGETEIHIYHDYTGISNWAKGTWAANNPCVKRYAAFCQAASAKINIVFHKVDAHSGDFYNEMADKLAKQGAKI